MKQTAMQQLLAQLKHERANIPMDIEWDRCYQAIETVIVDIYVPMEKEQMCDFFREGYMWCNSPSLRIENGGIVTSTMKYGEFYYNETFKQEI